MGERAADQFAVPDKEGSRDHPEGGQASRHERE